MQDKQKITKNGFLKVFILSFLASVLHSAEVPRSNAEAATTRSWSGIRLITLGTRYMTVIPTAASAWILKDLKNASTNSKVEQERKNMANSISEGMMNLGKSLVWIGAAKEFKDIFDYKANPSNPLNDPARYSPAEVKLYQSTRLKYLQSTLIFLRDKLKSQNVDAQWLVDLFDKKEADTLTESSLRLGLNLVGEVFEKLKIYGVGVQISSDYPVGSMISNILGGKLGNFAKYSGKVSYEDSHGILYYLKKGTSSDEDIQNDPLYRELPAEHPIVMAQKRDNYKFAATTYEQGGVQVEGVSYARGGSSNKLELINLTVRLTFFASTELLKNFEVQNLSKAVVTEISAQNNMSNIIADDTRKNAALKSQEFFEATLDKSKHFNFLSKNVQVAAARLWGQVDESTGELIEVPNFMLRLSIGNYAKAASKSRENSDIISLRGNLGAIYVKSN